MIGQLDFFETVQPLRGFQRDTFPTLRVKVTNMNLTGCTMRIVIEDKYHPGEAAMVRDCFHVQDPDGTDVYQVNLTSVDTQYLCGMYNVYFVLKDAGNNEYWRLYTTLEVLQSPEVTN